MPQALSVDWGMIQSLYLKGLSPKQIQDKTGVKADSVSTRAYRGKWRQALAISSVIVKTHNDSLPAEEPEAASLSKSSQRVRSGLASVLERSIDKLEQLSFKTPKAALKANQELESVVRNAKTVFGWPEGQSQPSVRISVLSSFAIAPAIEQSQAPVFDVTSTPIVEQEHDRNTLPPGPTPAQ